MLSSRAAFGSLPPLSLPPPSVSQPTPIPNHQHSAPIPTPSSLRTPSRQVPRSPYVNISPQRISRLDHQDEQSSTNSLQSSSPAPIEDVLNERDWVGEGLILQGERIRIVPPPNNPRLHYRPIKKPADHFEVVRKLGSGSYAVVYLVREIINSPTQSTQPTKHDDPEFTFGDDIELDVPVQSHNSEVKYGREFAIKCLSKAGLGKDALEAQLFEATIHQSLPPHPNIVTLYRTLETDSFLLLLLECVPGEDLYYFLEQARDHSDEQIGVSSEPCPSVTPPTPCLLSSLHPDQLLSPNRLRLIASMFAQMCGAVASCHRDNVFHRDIKPENFIVTDGFTYTLSGRKERRVIVKLTDFGLATNEAESADMDCGSAPYMSYECRNNCAPTYSTRAADVWSLGIVLINMLYHHNPWSDTTDGVCSSFEAFRSQPINFFLQRFTGMTREVAEFLATRVFCILEEHPKSKAQRVTAEEFGFWVKNLPTMLSSKNATPAPPLRSYFNPVVSAPRSKRPSSRPVSAHGDHSRTSSQRGIHPQLSINAEKDFELAEPDLPEEDDADNDNDACSRTTSTTRRRKRGARKKSTQGTLVDGQPNIAHDVQLLAREISKTSPSSGRLPPSPSLKKPSKWKDLLRMSNSETIDAPPQSTPFLPPLQPQTHRRPRQYVPSATAQNISSLIMGLSPDAVPAASSGNHEQWARGRRVFPPSKAAQFERANRSTSTLGEKQHSERGSSPTSTRGGSSSSNWRSSSAASSISGGTAFTRFSNSSMRSVSTVATSVSAASSWRNPNNKEVFSSPTNNSYPHLHSDTKDQRHDGALPNGRKTKPPLPPPPVNLKIISGVPWELGEFPRGCHGRPNDHVFSPPPLRYTMKQARAAAAGLDTINERASASAALSQTQGPQQRPESPSSSSDVGDQEYNSDGHGPKKVQKGQINTLAKMLSALKANRGAH
ncbi:kinase-like protein [Hysterangium stoloniferum]|nr:kinase-like protein [Hysterangium stoloniferum]